MGEKLQCNKQQKRDTLFFIGLVAGVLFMIWKSKFGMGAYDEPFYLTIPHRIVGGDGMLSDEWNFGQFSSFLLLPFMKLYTMFTNSTEGIIIHFRYLYIVFQVVCAIVLYIRLRKKAFAWLGALLFLLFCPYDIMAMSYNTMGVAFMTLVGVLLATAKEKDRGAWFFAGLLFAGAVLCNPFLAVLYFVYSVFVFIGWLQMRNKNKKIERNFSIQAWGYITSGAGLLAVFFAAAVLWNSSIMELVQNIPLLMNDPEHTSRSIFDVVKVYVLSAWNVYRFFLPVWAVLLFMAYKFRKNVQKGKVVFALMSASVVISLLSFIGTIQNSYNFIMLPITAAGLAAYIMTEQKDKRTFVCVFVWGWIYSFFANYASNQGMHAISMAIVPAAVGAVLLIGQYLQQDCAPSGETQQKAGKNGQAVIVIAAVCLLATQFGMQCYAKAVHAFWEEPVGNLDTTIAEGPLKGTVTTKEKADAYDKQLQDIKAHIRKNGPVLFATNDTWCYLYANTEYGTYSAYVSGGLKQSEGRWESYYDAHPEKIPYYVYLPKQEQDSWQKDISESAKEFGYNIEESEDAYHLYRE